MERLRAAILALCAENGGELDQWEQEVLSSFNAMPGARPITIDDIDHAFWEAQ